MSKAEDRWVEGTLPWIAPPTWALLERAVLDSIAEALPLFSARALQDDGSLRWDDRDAGRVRSDAFYECAQNWPLAYLLGGSTELLSGASRVWEGVTDQLTRYGQVADGFPLGEDWFHLAEGNLLFYGLCVATTADEADWTDRARRFANLYCDGPNWNPSTRALRNVVSATTSNDLRLPAPARSDYRWGSVMERYGLPLSDVDGISTYADLCTPAGAARMAEAIGARMAQGDVVQNLAATTLATVAYIRTGEDVYRRWVLDYVEAWWDRAEANGGLVPDNVGPKGRVGELHGGRWYGGYYGWTWPHGLYNIAMATIVAAHNAVLLSGDLRYLEFPRAQLEHVYGQGEQRSVDSLETILLERLDQPPLDARGPSTFVVPQRYRDSGWFDFVPPAVADPAALWALSMSHGDWTRLESLREVGGYDWNTVLQFRNKEENGHEAPWLRFLAGDNTSYPIRALECALAQIGHRVALIRADEVGLEQRDLDKHHFVGINPVVTELLLQLTTGSPQVVYNGGLPASRVTYRDLAADRPGLPPDVSALVTKLLDRGLTLELINLDPAHSRELLLVGGAFGEHEFTAVEYDVLAQQAVYPGEPSYDGERLPVPSFETVRRDLTGSTLRIRLNPGTRLELRIDMRRFERRPSIGLRR